MRILLAVDGSAYALNAARYVAERLWPADPDATIDLVHVVGRIPPRPAAAVGRAVVNEYYRRETEAAFKPVRKLFDARGIPCEPIRLMGNPRLEIVRHAESISADLVVLGCQGLGAVRNLLLGSVVQAVIAGCKTPLLVVREGTLPPAHGEVLVAIDGSAHSRRALAYLLRHRKQLANNSRLTLMHVSPPPPRLAVMIGRTAVDQHRKAEFEQAMRGARRLIAKAGIKCKFLHTTGDPGERIANQARGSHSSLIVMGSHGRGSMADLLLGSVAQKTLAATRAPVLIVR